MRTTALPLLAALAALLAGCASEPTTSTTPTLSTATTPAGTTPTPTPTPTPTTPTSSGPAPSSAEVAIAGFAFSPADVTVASGGTVRWTNADTAGHTATADEGAFDSGRLMTDDAFSHTFEEAGTFAYRCAIHPSMRGTVTVTA